MPTKGRSTLHGAWPVVSRQELGRLSCQPFAPIKTEWYRNRQPYPNIYRHDKHAHAPSFAPQTWFCKNHNDQTLRRNRVWVPLFFLHSQARARGRPVRDEPDHLQHHSYHGSAGQGRWKASRVLAQVKSTVVFTCHKCVSVLQNSSLSCTSYLRAMYMARLSRAAAHTVPSIQTAVAEVQLQAPFRSP